jgi:hypothetical protein
MLARQPGRPELVHIARRACAPPRRLAFNEQCSQPAMCAPLHPASTRLPFCTCRPLMQQRACCTCELALGSWAAACWLFCYVVAVNGAGCNQGYAVPVSWVLSACAGSSQTAAHRLIPPKRQPLWLQLRTASPWAKRHYPPAYLLHPAVPLAGTSAALCTAT